MWYSSTNEIALDFMEDFMKIDKAFGDKVTFTPRIFFWECIEGCDKELVEKHCFANGAYCGESETKLTGREVILEDLR